MVDAQTVRHQPGEGFFVACFGCRVQDFLGGEPPIGACLRVSKELDNRPRCCYSVSLGGPGAGGGGAARAPTGPTGWQRRVRLLRFAREGFQTGLTAPWLRGGACGRLGESPIVWACGFGKAVVTFRGCGSGSVSGFGFGSGAAGCGRLTPAFRACGRLAPAFRACGSGCGCVFWRASHVWGGRGN